MIIDLTIFWAIFVIIGMGVGITVDFFSNNRITFPVVFSGALTSSIIWIFFADGISRVFFDLPCYKNPVITESGLWKLIIGIFIISLVWYVIGLFHRFK